MTNTPFAAVIGWPIGHSKSPIIHRHWLAELGLSGDYVPLGIAPEDFATELRQLESRGFVGANVTIPHKEAALALADTVTDRARRIGAANTLVFRGGKIHADCTDGEGFLANLKQNAPDWDPAKGPAVILGAGGAARAIIVSLLDAGCPEVIVTNRTRTRADALASTFPIFVSDWDSRVDATAGCATLVNTTSLGMTGQPPLDMSLDLCANDCLVTDIVYTPLKTDLLKSAEALGLPTVDGIGMLLHQAVPGFEAWFGQKPAVTPSLREKVLAA